MGAGEKDDHDAAGAGPTRELPGSETAATSAGLASALAGADSGTVRGAALVYQSSLLGALGLTAFLASTFVPPLAWGGAMLLIAALLAQLYGLAGIYRDRYSVGFTHARKARLGWWLFLTGLVAGSAVFVVGAVMSASAAIQVAKGGASFGTLVPGMTVSAAAMVLAAAFTSVGTYLVLESLQTRAGVWLLRAGTAATVAIVSYSSVTAVASFIESVPELDLRAKAGLSVEPGSLSLVGGVWSLAVSALIVLATMDAALNAPKAHRTGGSAALSHIKADLANLAPSKPLERAPEAVSAPRPVSTETMLSVKGLKVQFFTYDGVVQALDGVDFEIREGETFGLVGETGCGKSVTARAVLRLIPDPPGRTIAGEAWFRGDNLLDGIRQEARIKVKKHGADIKRNKAMIRRNEEWMRAIRGREISMIFQEPMAALNPILPVGDQVAETILLHQMTDLVGEAERSATQDGAADEIARLVDGAGIANQERFSTMVSAHSVVLRPQGAWPRGAAETAREVGALLYDSMPYSCAATRAMGAGASGDDIVVPMKPPAWHVRWMCSRLRKAEEARVALREARRGLRLLERDLRDAIVEKMKAGGKAFEVTEVDEKTSAIGLAAALTLGFGFVKHDLVRGEAALGRTRNVIAAAKHYGISANELETSSKAVGRAERAYFSKLLRLPFLTRSRHEVQTMSPLRRAVFWFLRKSRYALLGGFGERALMGPVTTAAYGRALAMLKVVKIPHPERVLRMYPFELSGGMQQRVMIAIALACNPSLLIADEPTTALDVTIQAQILDLMKELKRKVGSAILLITHDLGVVAETCARVGVMYAGNIVEVAPTEEIFLDPKHPYTKGLISSIPKMDGARGELPIIEGSVPNLIKPPDGCRFHPRCPFAMVECKERKPALLPISPGHEVACFLYDNALEGERKEPLPGRIQLQPRPAAPEPKRDDGLQASLVA
jgi:oligopeptide/dipeptide ABC transporter ATP-binding protein